MRFSFSIKNVKSIKSLFGIQSGFIDVFVTPQMIVFFNKIGEITVLSIFRTETIEDYVEEESYNFRIPKKGFLSIVEDGLCVTVVSDDKVYLKISTKNHEHRMSFNRQICNLALIAEKLEILDSCRSYPKVNLSGLSLISKMSKISNKAITIRDGHAFVTLGGLQIYAKTKCSDMAFYAPLLNYFLASAKEMDNVYDVQNHIVYSQDGFGIILDKVNGSDANDLEFIKKQKTLFEAEVSFQSALSLLSKVRDYKSVQIDLVMKELTLYTEDSVRYSAPISVKIAEEEKSVDDLMAALESDIGTEGGQTPSIELPVEVFKNIIYATKSQKLIFNLTRKLIRLRVSDSITLVCSR